MTHGMIALRERTGALGDAAEGWNCAALAPAADANIWAAIRLGPARFGGAKALLGRAGATHIAAGQARAKRF